MNTKSELRNFAKNLRKTLDITAISREIVNNIRNSKQYMSANNVMLFYPLDNEIDLLPLLSDNKNFYLPRVNEKQLEVCPYSIGNELKLSPYKIKEPLTAPVNPNVLDVIFVPCLCADKNFNRIGYGGGFYDRFGIYREITRIIVVPDELVFEKVPTEVYDLSCDGIITQKKASFLRG